MDTVQRAVGGVRRGLLVAGLAVCACGLWTWHATANAAAQGGDAQNNPAVQRKQMVTLLRSLDSRLAAIQKELEEIRKAAPPRKP